MKITYRALGEAKGSYRNKEIAKTLAYPVNRKDRRIKRGVKKKGKGRVIKWANNAFDRDKDQIIKKLFKNSKPVSTIQPGQTLLLKENYWGIPRKILGYIKTVDIESNKALLILLKISNLKLESHPTKWMVPLDSFSSASPREYIWNQSERKQRYLVRINSYHRKEAIDMLLEDYKNLPPPTASTIKKSAFYDPDKTKRFLRNFKLSRPETSVAKEDSEDNNKSNLALTGSNPDDPSKESVKEPIPSRMLISKEYLESIPEYLRRALETHHKENIQS